MANENENPATNPVANQNNEQNKAPVVNQPAVEQPKTKTFDEILADGYQSEFDKRINKALLTQKEKLDAQYKADKETAVEKACAPLNDKIRNYALSAEIQKSGAHDPKDIISQLDIASLKFGDDGKIDGLDAQLAKLKSDKPYLFANTANGSTGLPHGNGAAAPEDAALRRAFGLPV